MFKGKRKGLIYANATVGHRPIVIYHPVPTHAALTHWNYTFTINISIKIIIK